MLLVFLSRVDLGLDIETFKPWGGTPQQKNGPV